MPQQPLNFYHTLETAIEAARQAAGVLSSYASNRTQLHIDHKASPNDLVSQADREAEQAILEVLQAQLPHIAVVAEESGTSDNLPDADFAWFIDPLDGTTNYLHGIPHYAVSIGLVARAGVVLSPNTTPLEHNTPIVAVVYDPNRQELFSAIHNDGAFLNGQRIYTSAPERLSDALFATGVPFRDFSFETEYMRGFDTIMHNTRGIRRLGSAALDLAWVACGRYDGYWEMGLAPYDVCAGTLLVREAGGRVEDLYQQEPWPRNGHIIASGKAVFEPFAQVIRQSL